MNQNTQNNHLPTVPAQIARDPHTGAALNTPVNNPDERYRTNLRRASNLSGALWNTSRTGKYCENVIHHGGIENLFHGPLPRLPGMAY